jgi:hypothetical protein
MHARWLPEKHIDISLEESNEHKFLFVPQPRTDASDLADIHSNLNVLHGYIVGAIKARTRSSE